MKTHTQKFWFFGIVALIATVVFSYSDTFRSPFTTSELAGAWIGYDNYRLQYYRLQLDEDGKGLCSVVYVDNPAQLYQVNTWKLEGDFIAFSLTPLDPGAEEIEMKSAKLGITKSVLVLEVRGKKLGWLRELTLLNEKKYLEKDLRARQRITDFIKGQSKSATSSKIQTNMPEQSIENPKPRQ